MGLRVSNPADLQRKYEYHQHQIDRVLRDNPAFESWAKVLAEELGLLYDAKRLDELLLLHGNRDLPERFYKRIGGTSVRETRFWNFPESDGFRGRDFMVLLNHLRARARVNRVPAANLLNRLGS